MALKVNTTIIGGGVIGCAIAYELSKEAKGEIVLLEKNSRIPGENQSSRNSGVIHAGIYYKKDLQPLKSKLCVEGNYLLYDFCEKNSIPYKKTGKLILATNKVEEEYLEDIIKTSKENDVKGIKKLYKKEINNFEPNVNATTSLYVPSSGIVEQISLVKKLYSLAKDNGVHFLEGSKLMNIKPNKTGFEVITKSENFETKRIINSAGLYSEMISKMINPESPYKIIPVRGESAKFYKNKRRDIWMNGMNVYPTPYTYYNHNGEKAKVHFKDLKRLIENGVATQTVGIHLTPTFDLKEGKYVLGNTVTIGPAKTININKEDYGSNLKSTKDYINDIHNYFPNLKIDDISLHQTGIMATLKDHQDFVIEQDKKHPKCINLLGIDSPGLTCSLAIAKYVKEIMN